MPLPKELASVVDGTHSIFLYCKSLALSANALAYALKQSNYWEVWSGKDVEKAQKARAPVVWLIGHGLSKTRCIVNDKGAEVIDMKDVVTWCESYGTAHLVDTCCYPSSRLGYVAKDRKPKLYYYCKKDDAVAKRIGNYQKDDKPDITVVDNWWDGEGMVKAYP